MAKKNSSQSEAQQIIEDLKQGNTKPIYLLHGKEPYFPDQITDYCLEHLLKPENKGFNQLVLYASEVSASDIVASAFRYPVGEPPLLVVVREAQQLKSIAPLVEYTAAPAKSTILLLNYRDELKGGAEANKKLLANAKKNGVVFNSQPYREYQIDGWIANRAKEKELELTPKALQILKQHLGTDLFAYDNAFDKLRLARAEGENKLSDEQVFNIIGVSREFNVFELNRAISNGDRATALKIALYMAQNPKESSPPMILENLYRHFYRTAQFIQLDGVIPRDEVAGRMGINPYFLREYQGMAARYSFSRVRGVFSWLRYFDLQSKGFYGPIPETSEWLKELIIRIMR